MIKTIIFDLDGTLVDLKIDFLKLKSKIKEILKIEAEPTPLLESIIHYTQKNPVLRQKAWDLIDQMELASINNLDIFSETISVLNRLRNEQYTLVLVTLQGRKAAQLILQLYFPNYFSQIITRENSHLRNIQIEQVIKSSNLLCDQVLMVGDRRNDVNSAKKVGINCLLIRRNYNPLEGTIVIKSLNEIFHHL